MHCFSRPSSPREAARRAQCTNNLKQIGLASHNYVSQFNVLPMQTTYPAGAIQSWGWSYGWPLALAPQLEQGNVFNNFNFADGVFGNAQTQGGLNGMTIQHGNDTLIAIQLATLICPSDGTRIRSNAPWGVTNYVGNMGGPGQLGMQSGTIISGFLGWGPDRQNGGPVGIENIRDGTSNTALFSERLVGIPGGPQILRSNIDFKRAVFDGPKVGGSEDSGGPAALLFIQGCQSLPGSTPSHVSWANGAVWLSGYPLHVVINDYLHAGTPNGPSCNNYTGPGSFLSSSWIYFVNPSGSAPPNSNHPAGVNVGLADGSVKFVKDSVGMQPWWSLGTRNGGDIISGDSY